MLLNPFERRLVSGWWRRTIVRRYDLPRLRRLGADLVGKEVLEMGCGHGYGVEACYDLMGAKFVHAFDPDPQLVAATRLAMTRSGRFSSRPAAKLWQGNAGEIPSADAQYEAVLSLQVLHHVEEWRAAVEEVARVLRPGGSFLLAESLQDFLEHPVFGRWMDHPSEDRFDRGELERELQRHGLEIVGQKGGRWMTWIHAKRDG
ncbi:MAG: class I SAM-dependent methyltransferase [Planctomycetota bacterium]